MRHFTPPFTVANKSGRVLIVSAKFARGEQAVAEVLPYSPRLDAERTAAEIAATLNWYPQVLEALRRVVKAGAESLRTLTPAQTLAISRAASLVRAIDRPAEVSGGEVVDTRRAPA